MHTLRYKLSFLTPAFLGNASQQAQWRTPPVKALLRQWWRVAYAAQKQFKVDIAAMRREEALLFGHAWLEDDAVERDGKMEKVASRKSQLRLRLWLPDSTQTTQTPWAHGTQTGVKPMPEDLGTSYAWFDLVKRAGLPDREAIKAGTPEGVRVLTIAAPDNIMPTIEETFVLIDAFGTLGSRSRGAWGSLHVAQVEPLGAQAALAYAQPLDNCLRNDWAMALACDERGLCAWQSNNTFPSWDKAMAFVAMARRQVRGAVSKELRTALGFAGTGRMPSPMRWKIVPEGNALRVRIFAMPHALPKDSGQSLSFAQLQAAWRTVCAERDDAKNLIRWKA
ncbi:MAG: hypothetical protein BGO13_00495 [Burkholderiales bacterium 66-5]|nr:MAG: hypothetical protein BGO13_00495 [Burkholderiales bacterium 66-5]